MVWLTATRVRPILLGMTPARLITISRETQLGMYSLHLGLPISRCLASVGGVPPETRRLHSQVPVACAGYSSVVRVWNMSDPDKVHYSHCQLQTPKSSPD